MIPGKVMLYAVLMLIAFCLLISSVNAQLPVPSLIGYWQNYNNASAPYIPLNKIDPRYNVIEVAFAVPHAGTSYQIEFIPDGVTPDTLIKQIQMLQAQGKKVLISIGGSNTAVSLNDQTQKNTFISTVNGIIDQYGFDGFDIDFEGSSVSVSGGTIAAPTDAGIINLIDAIKQVMQHHRAVKPAKLLLTMAPETAFVQGGQSAYEGVFGAYLPVINALRDSIDVLQVQLYNSGTMYGIDGNIYTQGTADFIVAMTEAVIKGFNTGGGMFAGLPAGKVAVGLPACSGAAGGGYTDSATVRKAMLYLLGKAAKPGSYTLQQTGGYPLLKGMMTFSINWDAVANCAGYYQYAANYQSIFAGAALPLTLQSFTGQYNYTGNLLQWVTAAQFNTAYFIVEKSRNGVNFYNADTIAANSSNRTLTYSYTDKDLTANNYYRLKITDYDGKFSYSSVIKVANEIVYTPLVYPNPARDYIKIKTWGYTGRAVVEITDVNGRMVKTLTGIMGAETRLNVSDLSAGLYFIKLIKDDKTYHLKIMKQ